MPPDSRVVVGTGALDARIRDVPPRAGTPAVAIDPYDPGELPDPGEDPPRHPPPGWDPTRRGGTCPTNLPGDYHPQEASRVYHPRLGSTASVHSIGATLLSPGDRATFEGRLASFMVAHDVPNAALAALDGSGRLIHCTGLTNLAVYQERGMQPCWAGPHSSFRVGSISKTFTAWSTMRLLDLDIVPDLNARLRDYVDLDRVPLAVEQGLVSGKWIPRNAHGKRTGKPDRRRDRVTLRHLLTHRGGWFDHGYHTEEVDDIDYVAGVYPPVTDADLKDHPGIIGSSINGMDAGAAAANRATWPVTQDHLLRYVNMWPLAFEPGSHYFYSNLGFWMLGRVIEGATCRGYESFVREALLRPLGMRDTRIGPDRSAERGLGEVPLFSEVLRSREDDDNDEPSRSQSYQDASGDYRGTDLVDDPPWARRRLRLADASGGWISSAYDLALYMRETFYRQRLLRRSVYYREMLSFQAMRSADDGMGYAWASGGWQGRGAWFHTGHLDGGAAEVAFEGTSRVSRNLSFIIMHNRWPLTGDDAADDGTDSDMREHVMKALRRVALPGGGRDLFDVLPP